MVKVLALDYGQKRIGVAISQGKLALPFKIIENKGKNFVLAELKKICEEEGVEKIVVGLPLSLRSRKDLTIGVRPEDLENEQMQVVLAFIEFLKKNLALPIETEDERLSSEEAASLFRGQKFRELDAVAAMLILQSWLDKQKV